eukprot:COSAG01_NODE_9549_length_2413_cov_2.239844_2_plen_100_part_00
MFDRPGGELYYCTRILCSMLSMMLLAATMVEDQRPLLPHQAYLFECASITLGVLVYINHNGVTGIITRVPNAYREKVRVCLPSYTCFEPFAVVMASYPR